MASSVIRALFTAQETISNSLNDIFTSTETLQSGISELSTEMTRLSNLTNISDSEIDQMRNSLTTLEGAVRANDQAVSEFTDAMREYKLGAIGSDEATERLQSAMGKMSRTAQTTDQTVGALERQLQELSASGEISDAWADRFSNSLTELGRGSVTANQAVQNLNRGLSEVSREQAKAATTANAYSGALSNLGAAAIPADIGQEQVAESADDAEREISQMGRSASVASGQLSILGAIAQASSFEFSSLSVNIGPFNVALRNIIIQLPTILTGMGALLALVTSLATAFLVLGGALGAFVGAGAIAFFEEFSGQFEDTQQAVEALMGALRDLFTAAIEPLMNEANMEMFIGAVNGAARVVNRFAQFFNQMRGDIMAFVSGVGGDMDAFFESLHDSFAIMSPVLQDFLNWFIEGLPGMLVTFAEITEGLSSALARLGDAFGQLFLELLQIGQLLLNSIAPVIAAVIEMLSWFFAAINSLNDIVGKSVLQFIALAAIFVRVQSIVGGVIGVFTALQKVMLMQAASGSALGRTFVVLNSTLREVAAGQMTLSGAMSTTIATLRAELAATRSSIAAKMQNLGAISANIIGYNLYTAAVNLATAATTVFYTALTGGLYAVVALIAALATAIITYRNWGAITSALAASMSFLMDSIQFLANFLISMFIPLINVLLSIFWAILNPAIAIVKGIAKVVSAMLGLSSASESGASSLGKIADVLFKLIDFLAIFGNAISMMFDFWGQLVALGITWYFNKVVQAINMVRDGLRRLREIFGVTSAITEFGKVMKDVFDEIKDIVSSTDEIIAEFASRLDRLPGINIDGPRIDASNVRDQMRKDSEEQDKDDIQTESKVDLSFEESLEQNVDVQADPEEKAQLSRITKDAIEEANSFARRRQGGQ